MVRFVWYLYCVKNYKGFVFAHCKLRSCLVNMASCHEGIICTTSKNFKQESTTCTFESHLLELRRVVLVIGSLSVKYLTKKLLFSYFISRIHAADLCIKEPYFTRYF